MPSALHPWSLTALRSAWAGRVGAEQAAFERPGVTALERPGADFVAVVALGRSVVVAGPEAAVARVGGLPSAQLLDPDALVAALGPWRPRLLGAALLAYADAGALRPVDRSGVRPADRADVESVLAQCSPADREENGLAAMDPASALDAGGWGGGERGLRTTPRCGRVPVWASSRWGRRSRSICSRSEGGERSAQVGTHLTRPPRSRDRVARLTIAT